MKKLLLGLLTLAIITLTLTSCQQPTAAATIAAHTPIVTGAVFFEEADVPTSGGMTWGTALEKKKTILSKSTNYRLGVFYKDSLADAKDIALSTNSSFTGEYWHWYWTPDGTDDPKGCWRALQVSFTSNSTLRATFPNQSNGNLYIRVTDSAGNVSSVYTITGITITN